MFKIEGNVVADSVVRTTTSQKPVLGFTVAVANRTKQDGSASEPTYVDCSVWGAKRVEAAAAVLKKGVAVELAGDAGVDAYLTKEGQKPAGKITLNVAFGDVLTFSEKGVKPTKAPLFPKSEEAAAE